MFSREHNRVYRCVCKIRIPKDEVPGRSSHAALAKLSQVEANIPLKETLHIVTDGSTLPTQLSAVCPSLCHCCFTLSLSLVWDSLPQSLSLLFHSLSLVGQSAPVFVTVVSLSLSLLCGTVCPSLCHCCFTLSLSCVGQSAPVFVTVVSLSLSLVWDSLPQSLSLLFHSLSLLCGTVCPSLCHCCFTLSLSCVGQ